MMLGFYVLSSLMALFLGQSLADASGVNGCPPDRPLVYCFVNPCQFASVCKAYPQAECRANYCGGCIAEFFVENQKVDCSVCRDGNQVLPCDSPCRYARPAPGYFCKPDFCGDSCSLTFERLCPDGSRPVECRAPACIYSKCGDPDRQCVSTYCGGCNAECVLISELLI